MLLTYLSVAYGFALAHWQLLSLGLLVLASILNRAIPGHPRFSGVLRQIISLLSMVPMAGARSAAFSFLAGKLGPTIAGDLFDWLSTWLDLPLISKSVPGSGQLMGIPPPKGFARVQMLIVLAAGLLLAAAALAGVNPEALKEAVASDPAAAQPTDPAAPPPSQFGGCVGAKKNVCLGPEIALSLVAFNFKTGKIEGAFAPGVGYGFVVNPGKWSSFGLGGYVTMNSGAQSANASVLASLFNGYFRPGLSKAFVNEHAWRFLLSTGISVP